MVYNKLRGEIMESKSILKSKTFWSNILVAVVIPFLPMEFKSPEYVGYALAAVNIVLRLISKGKVELV